ncbi:MAG: hypothetical protein NVSMB60_24750 [Mycobacterium sp.]
MYQYVSPTAISPTTSEAGSQMSRHRRVRQPTAYISTAAAIAWIASGAHPPSSEIGASAIGSEWGISLPYLRGYVFASDDKASESDLQSPHTSAFANAAY